MDSGYSDEEVVMISDLDQRAGKLPWVSFPIVDTELGADLFLIVFGNELKRLSERLSRKGLLVDLPTVRLTVDRQGQELWYRLYCETIEIGGNDDGPAKHV